jgi:hypothetical protein
VPPHPSEAPHLSLAHFFVQHVCPRHTWSVSHVLQVPPQLSGTPPHFPTQFGEQHFPWKHVVNSGQLLLQVPPHPSDAPPHLKVQSGLHLHERLATSQKICAPEQHWPKQHSFPGPAQLAHGEHVT